jgi:hypothetical protein
MPSPPLKPWEQQPGESDAAYAHFETYRDLGIDRSLDAAYRHWHEQNPDSEPGAESVKGRRASGQWHRECREQAWVARAGDCAPASRHCKQFRHAGTETGRS